MLAACLVLAVLAAIFAPSLHQVTNAMRKTARIRAYNALGDGTSPAGKINRLTDAAITTRHLLAKVGSDANHVAIISAASDRPVCVLFDEASAAEQAIGGQLLGVTLETVLMVAQGTIAANVDVFSYGDGTITTLPGTAGTFWKVGVSRTAATAGQVIEVEPCTPEKLIVLATLGNTDAEISGLTIGATYSQSEVQALRTKLEELADDVRALAGAMDGSAKIRVL